MKKLLLILVLMLPLPALGQVQNTLTWQEGVGSNETGFNIYRKAELCQASGAFTQIATVGANVFTYVDKAVVEGQFYCYRVTAAYPGGESGPSNLAGRTVPFVVPPVPTNLNVGP